MELGVLLLLAVTAAVLGWFWMDGVATGERLMKGRS